jgi:hypothetical protein
MNKGFLGCLAALVVGTGLATAETPETLPDVSKSLSSTQAADQTLPPAKTDTTTGPAPTPAELSTVGEPGLPADGDGYGVGRDHCWVDLEYLLWRTKKMHIPALITTGPNAGQGIIGQPGTVVLFGGGTPFDEEARSGFRVSGGMYLGCEQCWNLEYELFYFPKRDENRQFNGFAGQLLARPFFSLNTMQETSEINSLMGLAKAIKNVSTPFQFGGAEVNLSRKLCCGCCCRVDLLGGFRYLYMQEAVNTDEFIQVNTTLPPQFQNFQQFAGDTITVSDRFRTRNQFYGGQVGLEAVCARGPWQLFVRGKVALGDTHEILDISGSQTVTTPTGQVTHFTGGLLALQTNIGHFNHDEFSVVPEVTVNLGYRLSHCFTIYAGYNFLYWSRVARAGEQIDRIIDTTLIPNFAQSITPTGFARPGVLFNQNDFWAQGLNVGLEITW